MASAASSKSLPEFRDLSPTSSNLMRVDFFKIGPSEALIDRIRVECRRNEDQFIITNTLSANIPPAAPSPSRYQLIIKRNADKEHLTILFKGQLTQMSSRAGAGSLPELNIEVRASLFPELENKIYSIFETSKAQPIATLYIGNSKELGETE